MKKTLIVLYTIFSALFISCNQNEGLGGSSSLEGFVYNVVHKDDDYSIVSDTFPAAGEKVYIVYSDDVEDPVADKDVDTNKNGMFRFEYLRKGNYTIYALSSYPDELGKKKEAVWKTVKVGSGTAHSDTIYIHSGQAYGLSMIKGTVMAQYYDKTTPRGTSIAAVETRVYIKRQGETTFFNDVRVGNEGTFVFQKIPPGTYEIYTTTEEINVKNRLIPTPVQVIEVKEAHHMYVLPEIFEIKINI